jgi:alkanesulfonate monooxygenase SsuD/methylene tetrahydromethanopterin reductase-like flavin-dependent oxidoreductase (luciferase family)
MQVIKSWVFEFFHALPKDEAMLPGAVKRQFDRHFDLWVEDESLGFEGIFFSEHHFGPGYSPNPHLLVAAMASRTKRMRLGTLGVSTSYVEPLRIVEEAAMLDNITDGRFELGIVRGIPHELGRLGLSLPEGDERFDQSLRAIEDALRTADGDFKLGNLEIRPPLRQPDLPRWLAVTSERSSRRAASLGWKICAGFLSVAEISHMFDCYREEAGIDREAGLERLGVRRRILFVENDSEVAEAKAGLKAAAIAHVKAGSENIKQPTGAAQPTIDIDAMIKRMLSDDEFIVGTPASIADQIVEQCRAMGCVHFQAGLDSSNVFDELVIAHRRYGREVIPLLQKADISAMAS